MAASFDRIVRDAQALPVSGWDTSPVEGRWTHRSPPWDYRRSVLELSASTRTLLDLGTGGGEFLATLAPLPPSTYATEGYAANVPIARRRLEPLGVRVISIGSDGHIDLPAESVGLVVCRHEAFDPVEVRRVLSRRGTFVTQQVGALNYSEIHQRFAVAHSTPANAVQSARSLAEEISSAGLAVSEQREARY
ncbi:MAG: class I SAM-dependent methyltransferase, partial [Thermoplasmata archaeon]